MSEVFYSERRKARKEHRCDFCGRLIKYGDYYHRAVSKEYGEVHTWRTHEKCEYIAKEIWDYSGIDDGMSDEDFQENVREICRNFICPDCKHFDADNPWEDDCEEEYGCDELEKVYDLLQKYELYKAWEKNGYAGWKLRRRKKK